jgi:glycosyltransferase involved in cell wall biosynthesis
MNIESEWPVSGFISAPPLKAYSQHPDAEGNLYTVKPASKVGDFPRVLLIGVNPMEMKGAQGITVANLFSGWNKDALAQLFLADRAPDPDLCRNNLRLAENVFPGDYYIRSLLGKAIKVDHLLTHRIGAVGPSKDDKISFRIRMHLIARAVSDLGPCVLPGAAGRWIRDFRPDVIYSCLGNVRLIKLALAASRVAGDVPIVPHFMDDWPATLYADGRMLNIPKNVVMRLLRSIFRRAPLGFCIGELMAEEYKIRYGLDFFDFMNCVNDEEFEASPHSGNPEPSPMVWAYVGGLHLNRWKPLTLLAQCVSDHGAILRIFAPAQDISDHGSHFSDIPNVEMGSLAPGDVLKAMKASDILVHVESFDQAESVYTQYSVSTKLAQYLSCWRPVFGFGPGKLASIKLIEDAKAGITVKSEDREQLVNAVSLMAGDSDFRRDCARNGFLYANNHFKKSAVSDRFRRMLMLAAAENRAIACTQ